MLPATAGQDGTPDLFMPPPPRPLSGRDATALCLEAVKLESVGRAEEAAVKYEAVLNALPTNPGPGNETLLTVVSSGCGARQTVECAREALGPIFASLKSRSGSGALNLRRSLDEPPLAENTFDNDFPLGKRSAAVQFARAACRTFHDCASRTVGAGRGPADGDLLAALTTLADIHQRQARTDHHRHFCAAQSLQNAAIC